MNPVVALSLTFNILHVLSIYTSLKVFNVSLLNLPFTLYCCIFLCEMYYKNMKISLICNSYLQRSHVLEDHFVPSQTWSIKTCLT